MPRIEHVFVLMLENRSFDHMLAISGTTGTDAATGASKRRKKGALQSGVGVLYLASRVRALHSSTKYKAARSVANDLVHVP